ncbi:hypothetical protein WA158_002193 [Blastocystis sp. Blastoise]
MSLLRKTNTLSQSLSFLKLNMFKKPMIQKEFRKPLTIIGCNYEGKINGFSKALQHTAESFVKFTGKPLQCNYFGGLYYDEPHKFSDSNSLWNLFIVLEDEQLIKELKHTIIPYHYISTIPQSVALKCQLPNENELSVLFGMMRAYPTLNKYLKDNLYPKPSGMMELYNNVDSTMEFIYFLNNSEYFEELKENSFLKVDDLE